MKFREWLKDLDYEVLQGDLDTEAEDVVYDSRKAVPGTIFVCLKGTRIDSHGFIGDVAAQGVKAFVVERDVELPEGTTVVKVASSRHALAMMSAVRFGNPIRKMISVGVTGTKGKTTATHMMKAILEAAGKKVGMIGTTGAVIGDEVFPTMNTTPESYQLQEYFSKMAEAGCEYVLMEVSSQGIKMHRTDGLEFDYGVFTNITPDHIGPDEHADFEEYLYYKSRLFTMCRTGIANRDDEHFEAIVKDRTCGKLYTYGRKEGGEKPDFYGSRLRFVSEPGFVGTEFDLEEKATGAVMDLRLGLPGEFNVDNALAAASLCRAMGISEDAIREGLEHVRVNGRMEIAYSSEKCTVIIDYAHNAVSMESLLETLRAYHPKRLVCVFGSGGNRSKERRYSMGEIGGKMADLCILTADNSRYEKTEDIIADIRSHLEPTGGAFVEIPDRREAIYYSLSHAQSGDMIAIIGKGHEDYQEINGVRTHFLDREVVEEAVKELGL
ncbi:MAG TPA: UDP-N-acetylmuramoyl-L-alanyl-D-glutamate--2,6-diaminopimelate ligase [Candidatus Lachnoclostridium avicola]|nr:UDP-N-acetylmuramoyl-L-alanyl-D-glutamate--2,6-diaminopimelate ligase [Candidatus Lachnoclostridium avicola]